MPVPNPKFAGRVEARPPPITPGSDPAAGDYADLRLWVADIVRMGARLDPGYVRVGPRSRTGTASLNGKRVGYFVQMRAGTYHNGLPKYCFEGIGRIER